MWELLPLGANLRALRIIKLETRARRSELVEHNLELYLTFPKSTAELSQH
jgi:hypothetical protein